MTIFKTKQNSGNLYPLEQKERIIKSHSPLGTYLIKTLR